MERGEGDKRRGEEEKGGHGGKEREGENGRDGKGERRNEKGGEEGRGGTVYMNYKWEDYSM